MIISHWVEDILAMVDDVIQGPVVITTSSMGGWLSTYVAKIRPSRIVGLVLIGEGNQMNIGLFSKINFISRSPI